jgi:membrane peptidoglycan carboxypeptidase
MEDKRFFRHNGFDLIAFSREILKAMLFRNHGGASTIDMQFVRTATNFRRKTIGRKVYETILATLIQFRYPKFTILRSYLRSAYFGSGLYGAEKASLKEFGRALGDLSSKEAATVAAMLVYPRPVRPRSSWRLKIERRSAYGLARLRRLEQSLAQLPGRE